MTFGKRVATTDQAGSAGSGPERFVRHVSAFSTSDAVADEAHSSTVGRHTGRDVYEAPDHLPYLTEYYLNYYRFWSQFKDGLPPQSFRDERIAKLGGGNGDYSRSIARIAASENIEGTRLIIAFHRVDDDLNTIPEAYLEPLPADEPYWRNGDNSIKFLNYMSAAALYLMATSRALAEFERQFKVKITQVELRWKGALWWFGTKAFKLSKVNFSEANVTPLANGDYLFGSREVQS